ncbi:hypothetical protein NRIC_11250 [Enterococcus florum]|uniref:Transport permease protein n=1 Tax=Enterococcus florum TaxID=2480627 RepID=A0A4P5PA38_9ENTE|nr:ABC transporter permease [Enterococcus florum]GCF93234.1 hypothetical protein NRIC_11250 [Enterococcus florum]
MKKYWIFLKVEGKLAIRSMEGIIFGIGMPIGVLLLITMISGTQTASNNGHTFLQNSFPALATVGICATAFMGLPITISDYRDKKILRHFFTTPSSPSFFLSIQFMICTILAFSSTLGVTLVATLVLNYQMTGSWVGFILVYLFVLIAMYSIGMMMASLCKSSQRAHLVSTLVYFPMLFFSGAVIPYEIFPDGLQKVAQVLPLTQGIRLLKIVSFEDIQAVPLLPLIYLCVLAFIGILVSIKTFRWE